MDDLKKLTIKWGVIELVLYVLFFLFLDQPKEFFQDLTPIQ